MTTLEISIKFNIYNIDYFDGVLELPEFKIIHSKKILGCFTCMLDFDDSLYNPLIEISDAYLYTEEQFRNLLLHEMIHYYLAYTQEDINVTHGKAFKKLAKRFNDKYGLNITTTTDATLFIRNKKKNWLSRLFGK